MKKKKKKVLGQEFLKDANFLVDKCNQVYMKR
jgi:hypothetical protein